MLWNLLLGLVVGSIAKLVMPGKSASGVVGAMLIGVTGAFLATILGRIFGWYEPGQSAGFIASLLGALLLLWIYRRFALRHSTT